MAASGNTLSNTSVENNHPGEQASKKPSFLKIALLALLVCALGGGAFAAFGGNARAPDISFTTIQGKKIALNDLRGKVVMVNFWATSCTTCVAEMPMMIKTYNTYQPRGLDYIAVATSYDRPDYVLNYAKTRQLPFDVTLDPEQKAASAFGDVQLTPTTFVIDKQGRIIKRYVGQPDEKELHALLDKALAT